MMIRPPDEEEMGGESGDEDGMSEGFVSLEIVCNKEDSGPGGPEVGGGGKRG